MENNLKRTLTPSELIDKNIAGEEFDECTKNNIANELNQSINTHSIVIAQANPSSGNIEYNAKQALKYIEWAEKLNVDAVVFPELYLTGSPVGDIISSYPIIIEENEEWLLALAQKTGRVKIIIGFIQKAQDSDKFYNAIAVLHQGKIERIIRKSILCDKGECADSRNFISFPFDIESRILDINGKKACILIGDESFEPPAEELRPDYILKCAASVSRAAKETKLNQRLSTMAKNAQIPLIYVNQTGAGESYSYEGASRVYGKNGNLTWRAKAFCEQFFIVNPYEEKGFVHLLPYGMEVYNPQDGKIFSLEYENDLERTYLTVAQAIKDYFKKSGFKRAVLGLSGGLDSTVCAVILADVLGPQNVLGISMPSAITCADSKNDAKQLAQNLGIVFTEVSIRDMCETVRDELDTIFTDVQSEWNCRCRDSFTNDNIQARSRAVILWGAANEFENALTIATSDKSELYMGYATINGDMSGSFAPIADITKTKLFALAHWMNKHRRIKNAIPESILNKRPGAELAINPKTNKPLLAEEALMPYEFLDEVIWRVENLGQSAADMLDKEFLYEKKENISKEQKTEWLEKFFRRMACSVYKLSIMPPFPMVDAHSLSKAEYRQPVISSRVNFLKTTLEDKVERLSDSSI